MATPTRRLADTLLPDGGVTRFITDRRATGRAWRLIARDLYEQTNGEVDVTPETVRKWAAQLTAAA